MSKSDIGQVTWIDISVEDAGPLKDFYQQVVGWQSQPLSMGEYDDFVMVSPAGGEGEAGICHARGVNGDLPPVWLPYFLVADVDASAAAVTAQGGALVTPIKTMGQDRYVVIRDPAGAACALYQKG